MELNLKSTSNLSFIGISTNKKIWMWLILAAYVISRNIVSIESTWPYRSQSSESGTKPSNAIKQSTSKNVTHHLPSGAELYPALQNRTLETIQRIRANKSDCYLRSRNKFLYASIQKSLEETNLIEYKLNLRYPNYTGNILLEGLSKSHKADHWARVKSNHGRTLLTLAFNYGILSLMTLKIGTELMNVDLEDVPLGCFVNIEEEDKVALILELLMKDFREDAGDSPIFTGTVCHEIIEDNDGYAKFSVFCCGMNEIEPDGKPSCDACKPNGWLTFLYILLAALRVSIVAFGPLFFLSAISGLTRDEFPYTVKLKEPQIKTILLCRSDEQPPDDIKPNRVLNLTNKRGFPKLRESVYNAPCIGKPFQAKITQYDINVNYRRLLTENKVPIGFWKSIARAIFFCKLRNIEPFQQCCRTNMFRHRLCSCIKTPVPWINLWRKVGLALLVLVIPVPYYIRLFILYNYEYEELISRKEAAQRLQLRETFEYNLIHYLLPDHPIFITIYIIYFLTALILAYMARRSDEGRFRKIIVGAFTDLKHLSWIKVLRLLISNIIWPFRRYGLMGLLVAIIYWPIAVPLTVIVYLFYCLPTVYLTVRMFFYSRRAFLETVRKFGGSRSYRVHKHLDDTMHHFDVECLLGNGDEEAEGVEKGKDGIEFSRTRQLITQRSHVSETYELDEIDNLNPDRLSKFRRPSVASVYTETRAFKLRRHILHLLAASLSVISLYSILVIMSECVGCFIEILVFTTMGIIVNANQLLKYIALLVLVVAYSYDSFNNVEKRYLKLNKALFSEVKFRIKDLEKVTSLPSYLQENHGFKSQELNEQADYEMPDDITEKPSRHWMINDLVLFIDNEDMPRIPKKLFEDVCQIRVAGVPGPIYAGLLEALKQFLKIFIFVVLIFVVILSFGSAHQISSTNQMLAALAGGSLPLIMRTFMEPEKPEIEMGTVSFKSKLDEVIKNFAQLWPIYDFPFEEYKPEEENKDDSEGDKNENDKNKDKNKDKNNDKKKETSNDKDGEKEKPKNKFVDRYKEKEKFRNSLKLKDKSKEATKAPSKENTKISNSFLKPPEYSLAKLHDRRQPDGSENADAVEKSGNHTSFNSSDGSAIHLEVSSTKSDKSNLSTPKVCFKDAEEALVTKVDILINLPLQYDEVWLDEWSDIGDVAGSKGPNIEMSAPPSRRQSLDNVFLDNTDVVASRV